jgi:hypothetical protein
MASAAAAAPPPAAATGGGNGGGAAAVKEPITKEMGDLHNYERELYTQLDNLERAIYIEESKYLDDIATSSLGNIISGWEGAMEGKGSSRKAPERIFSGSSATFEQQQKEAAAAAAASAAAGGMGAAAMSQ